MRRCHGTKTLSLLGVLMPLSSKEEVIRNKTFQEELPHPPPPAGEGRQVQGESLTKSSNQPVPGEPKRYSRHPSMKKNIKARVHGQEELPWRWHGDSLDCPRPPSCSRKIQQELEAREKRRRIPGPEDLEGKSKHHTDREGPSSKSVHGVYQTMAEKIIPEKNKF